MDIICTVFGDGEFVAGNPLDSVEAVQTVADSALVIGGCKGDGCRFVGPALRITAHGDCRSRCVDFGDNNFLGFSITCSVSGVDIICTILSNGEFVS